MASNRELMAQAETLAKELELPPPRLFGMTHDALAQLVEDLQARLAKRALEAAATAPAPAPKADEKPAPAPTPPPAAAVRVAAAEPDPPKAIPPPPLDGATGKLAEVPPTPPPAPQGVSVAPGKSITSLRGMLAPGTVVTAKDFTHGQKTVDDLLSKGILVKV